MGAVSDQLDAIGDAVMKSYDVKLQSTMCEFGTASVLHLHGEERDRAQQDLTTVCTKMESLVETYSNLTLFSAPEKQDLASSKVTNNQKLFAQMYWCVKHPDLQDNEKISWASDTAVHSALMWMQGDHTALKEFFEDTTSEVSGDFRRTLEAALCEKIRQDMLVPLMEVFDLATAAAAIEKNGYGSLATPEVTKNIASSGFVVGRYNEFIRDVQVRFYPIMKKLGKLDINVVSASAATSATLTLPWALSVMEAYPIISDSVQSDQLWSAACTSGAQPNHKFSEFAKALKIRISAQRGFKDFERFMQAFTDASDLRLGNFEKALRSLHKHSTEKMWQEAITIVQNQFTKMMETHGEVPSGRSAIDEEDVASEKFIDEWSKVLKSKSGKNHAKFVLEWIDMQSTFESKVFPFAEDGCEYAKKVSEAFDAEAAFECVESYAHVAVINAAIRPLKQGEYRSSFATTVKRNIKAWNVSPSAKASILLGTMLLE